MLVCIFAPMKISYIVVIVALALAIVSCQKSTEHADHHDDTAVDVDSANVILYNQVMDIHDEVMPKMEDLYNMKKDLQEKLKTATQAASKQDIELRLAEIDSASKMMMDWMHEFNPPPDSVDQEVKRTYLEAEMVKVKQVKEAILTVLGSDTKVD